MNVLQKLQEIEKQYNIQIIYCSLSGSKLYGTDTENSDTDMKFLFIPDVKDVLLKKDKEFIRITPQTKLKNTKDDIDFDGFSIYKFLHLVEKSETGAIDILFSMFSKSIIFEDKKYTDIIRRNYKSLLNKNMHSFIGYALGQTKKFNIKGARFAELSKFNDFLGTLEITEDSKVRDYVDEIVEYVKDFKYIKVDLFAGARGSQLLYVYVLGKLFILTLKMQTFVKQVQAQFDQFGNRTRSTAMTEDKVDYKALSHSLRIALEVQELLLTKFIRFPLKDADLLRDIKQGKHDVDEVIGKVESVLANVDDLLLNSDLPEKSDKDFIEDCILTFLEL